MHEIIKDFNQVKLGETACYHIGSLAEDREYDIELCSIADKAFALSTVKNVLTTNFGLAKGTGEFELKQRKIRHGIYMYLAKRIREAV